MLILPESLVALIEKLAALPRIGRGTAEAIAFHLVRSSDTAPEDLAKSIVDVRKKVRPCSICGWMSESDVCPVCSDESRDRSIVCAVETHRDVAQIERSGAYHGVYHVLMGHLSPLDGVGPEDIEVERLLRRIQSGDVREVVVATSPTVEGDATAVYLEQRLKELGVKVTRLSRGVSAGAEIQFTSPAALAEAIKGRK